MENVVWGGEIHPGVFTAVKCWVFAAWAEGPCAQGTMGSLAELPWLCNTQRSTGQGTGCCFAPTLRTSRGAQSLRAPTAELRGAGLQNPGGLHQQKQARGAQQPPRVPPGISSHRATGTGDGATALGWLRLAAAGSG